MLKAITIYSLKQVWDYHLRQHLSKNNFIDD